VKKLPAKFGKKKLPTNYYLILFILIIIIIIFCGCERFNIEIIKNLLLYYHTYKWENK